MLPATVAITGANGFLGRTLSRCFASAGARVIALSRRRISGPNVEWRRYELTARPPADILAGADAVVHCAYVHPARGIDAMRSNIEGSRQLFDLARGADCRIVFISSLAAHDAAVSEYGKLKLATERLLDMQRDVIVRPGLVLGAGGFFERTARYLERRRYVPVLDGGRQRVQTVYAGDLAACMLAIGANDRPGLFTIADPAGTPFRDFYEALGAALGVRIRCVNLPSALVLAGLSFTQRLGIALPIDRDNVLGLRAMVVHATTPFEQFGVRPKSLREALALAVAEMRAETDGAAQKTGS